MDEDTIIPDSELQSRRDWFDLYCARIDRVAAPDPAGAPGPFTSPCCGYPTLNERGGFDICILCFWEDDGQDDPFADEMWGGPNSNCSLTQARHNFKSNWIMYAPDDDKRISGPDSAIAVAATREVAQAYDALRLTADEGKREILMMKVDTNLDVLRSEMDRKVREFEARSTAMKKNRNTRSWTDSQPITFRMLAAREGIRLPDPLPQQRMLEVASIH